MDTEEGQRSHAFLSFLILYYWEDLASLKFREVKLLSLLYGICVELVAD